MAVGTFEPYDLGLLSVLENDLDFESDTIKAALLDDAYTPDKAAHQFWSDISADEIADGDYAQQTLAGKAITVAVGIATFDADDLDFGNAVSIAARYLVLYQDTGVPGTSRLFGFFDLNDGGSGNVSAVGSDFDVAFGANGIYRITL